MARTEYEGRLRISRSSGGGRTFSQPRHIAGGGALPARAPSIAVDDAGDIAVVNSTFRPGERSLVRLIRGHLER